MSYMATLQASWSSHLSAADGKKADISTNDESWTEICFLIFHLLISDDCSCWKNRALKLSKCLPKKFVFHFAALGGNWTLVMKIPK